MTKNIERLAVEILKEVRKDEQEGRITVVIPLIDKKKFFKKVRDLDVSPSEFLRKKIYDFLESNS